MKLIKNRKINFLLFGLIIVGFPLMIFGCQLGHKQYKTAIITSADNCSLFENAYFIDRVDCRDKVNPKLSRSKFNVVEIDDFGAFHNPLQYESAMDSLYESTEDNPTLLVIYIHGWRHNASENSYNLVNFRDFIFELGNNLAGKDRIFGRYENVNGIYLSWRGDSLALPKKIKNSPLKYLELLTFWDRYDTAKNIANTNVTGFILELLSYMQSNDENRLDESFNTDWGSATISDKNTSRQPGPMTCISLDYLQIDIGDFCSRSIVIGHSMGARILENTISQALVATRQSMSTNSFDMHTYDLDKSIERVREARSSVFTKRAEYVDFAISEVDSFQRDTIELERLKTEFFIARSEYEKRVEEYVLKGYVNEKTKHNLYLPPIDTTVLVNTASDALSSFQLSDQLKKSDSYLVDQIPGASVPWVISLSSVDDDATSAIFPFSRWISHSFSLIKSKPNNQEEIYPGAGVSQRELLEKTAPFIDEMNTHEVSILPKDSARCAVSLLLPDETMLAGVRKGAEIYERNTNNEVCKNYIGGYGENHWRLLPNVVSGSTEQNNDEYWIFQVPGEIISDHNDIFTAEFSQLLTLLSLQNVGVGSACRDTDESEENSFCRALKYRLFLSQGQWPKDIKDDFEFNKSLWLREEGYGILSIDYYEDSQLIPKNCLRGSGAELKAPQNQSSPLATLLECH